MRPQLTTVLARFLAGHGGGELLPLACINFFLCFFDGAATGMADSEVNAGAALLVLVALATLCESDR